MLSQVLSIPLYHYRALTIFDNLYSITILKSQYDLIIKGNFFLCKIKSIIIIGTKPCRERQCSIRLLTTQSWWNIHVSDQDFEFAGILRKLSVWRCIGKRQWYKNMYIGLKTQDNWFSCVRHQLVWRLVLVVLSILKPVISGARHLKHR